jgi:hypothetical protein
MMLKTTLFFLFGCSLYFGQSIATTGLPNQADSACTNCPMNMNTAEGDGTRASNNGGGGSGTLSDAVSLATEQTGNNLNIYLMPFQRKFTTYIIYDLSGNVKKEQQIPPTNSYSIDVSNLSPGNYLIEVEVASPSTTITESLLIRQ